MNLAQVKGPECSDLYHAALPITEPDSKSRICKTDFSLEQGEVGSSQYTECWDTQSNQQKLWRSKAQLKCSLLQGLHSPKLEARACFLHIALTKAFAVSVLLMGC